MGKLGLKRNTKFYLIQKKYFNTDKNYFSNINERNCYWAGFIGADGNIFENYLQLSQNEKDVIERFVKEINYEGKINAYPIKNNKIHYKVQVYEEKIVKDLFTNFNITSCKSLNLQPPQNLNKRFALCYLAGYIDGDGSIRIADNGQKTIKLGSGSLKIIEYFKQNSFTHYTIGCSSKNRKNPEYRMTLSGKYALIFAKEIFDIIEIRDLLFKRKWGKIIPELA